MKPMINEFGEVDRNRSTRAMSKYVTKQMSVEDLRKVLEDYKKIRRDIRWVRRRVRRAINAQMVAEKLTKNKCEQCSGRGCLFCETA